MTNTAGNLGPTESTFLFVKWTNEEEVKGVNRVSIKSLASTEVKSD